MLHATGLATLPCEIGRVRDGHAFILEAAKGRSVLNVGAAGGVEQYLPDRRHVWLHHRLGEVASSVVGIDIDEEAIAHAKRHGVTILTQDCETMDLGRRFDLVVVSDVIEHLGAPQAALAVLRNHLSESGKIILTTPNLTAAGIVIRALLGRAPPVYRDHTIGLLPEHLTTLCARTGLELERVLFFQQQDRHTFRNRVTSMIGRAASAFNPRLAASFLAVLAPRAGSQSH